MEAIRNLIERHVEYTGQPARRVDSGELGRDAAEVRQGVPARIQASARRVPRTQEAVKSMAVKGSETTQEVRA